MNFVTVSVHLTLSKVTAKQSLHLTFDLHHLPHGSHGFLGLLGQRGGRQFGMSGEILRRPGISGDSIASLNTGPFTVGVVPGGERTRL